MDYLTWVEKPAAVNSLTLDPKNPRIPPSNKPLDQRALIAELINHDKVYELAQNIAQNGYYPVEALICIKQDHKMVVIEGNRRLAALKLLIAPEAAPDSQIPKFFVSLSNRVDKTRIRKVKVLIAPNREATAPILMSRHTNPQVERWDTIMQASFYLSLLQNGISVDDLSAQYSIPRLDVLELLRLHKMYEIACRLELPDEVAQVVRNPREFKATTLKRFYERPVSQRFLGITLSNQTADVVGMVDEDEFKKGYKRVVTDIATGKVDSRDIGTTEQVAKYIEKIPASERPDLTKKGTFSSTTLLQEQQEQAATPVSRGSMVGKKPKKKPLGLIPNNVSCDVNNQRINDTFNELRTLPVYKYPNATAVLFRSLLEMALSHYLDVSGDLYTIIEEEKQEIAKKGRTLKKDWHPSLRLHAYLPS